MKNKLLVCSIALISGALNAVHLYAQSLCTASFTFNSANDPQISFTNTSTGGSSPVYAWNFGDGTWSYSANPVHTYTANGTYYVCLDMNDSLSCWDSVCTLITITNAANPPCSANFYSYPDSLNNGTYYFYDWSAGNPVSWFWDFGDGNTSSVQNPVHQYSLAGTYMVCLTIINSLNDTCTFCDSLVYYPCTISAGFTFNSSSDPQISFTNTSTGGSFPSYSWYFGDGSLSYTTNAVHTYTVNGTYYPCLTLYDSLGNCSDTYCTAITITNAPNLPCNAFFYVYPDSSQTGNFYFYDASSGNPVSWFWDFGDGNTSTLQYPAHQYAVQGDYWVCLTIITSAPDTCTFCDTVSYKLTSITESNNSPLSFFDNYPNPFNQFTTITYSLAKSANMKILIYDRMGCKVGEIENTYKNTGKHQAEWNAEKIPAGIYHLEINADGNLQTKKLAVIK